MKVSQIAQILRAEVRCGEENLDLDISYAVASDMMSDVLVCNDADRLLITGLCTVHTLLTAQILDLRAVVFVRSKRPTPEMIEVAQQNGIAILCTDMSMYNACGELYKHGMKGRARPDGTD